jgi:hypothetical protein
LSPLVTLRLTFSIKSDMIANWFNKSPFFSMTKYH